MCSYSANLIAVLRLQRLHVKENLEARVEAVVGDLLPDLAQLILIDLIHLHLPAAAQRVEKLHRELLRLRHPCIQKLQCG